MDETIREAFQKVKQDTDFLKQELVDLKKGLIETRETMIEICEIIRKIHEKQEKHPSTHELKIPTTSTHPSTHQHPFKPLKPQNIPISTGNQGVSTDRQTDRQTHQQTPKTPQNNQFMPKIEEPLVDQNIIQNTPKKQDQNSIENAVEMLESLDNIKKEIRLKFKRLTEQELLVFSAIYQLDEEYGHTDHKSLSKMLNLSESSIRDYVGRIIKKGIPVDKRRVNNKNIQLTIPQSLKKIASLSTILQLRDL